MTISKLVNIAKTLAASGGALVLLGACTNSSPEASENKSQASSNSAQTKHVADMTRPSPTVIASGTPASAQGQRIVVNHAYSDPTGFTSVTWTMTNTGSTDIDMSDIFEIGGSTEYTFGQATNVKVIVDGTRYWTLKDDDAKCICTEIWSEHADILPPGESVTFYNSYLLPPNTQTINVKFPGFKAVKGVPVE